LKKERATYHGVGREEAENRTFHVLGRAESGKSSPSALAIVPYLPLTESYGVATPSPPPWSGPVPREERGPEVARAL
jgi:hypothetical protein